MNTDNIMVDTWLSLARDFRFDDRHLFSEQESALRDGIETYRNVTYPERMQAPIYLHKCIYQMENLFKRYTFKNDAYTKEQLEQKANEDFIAFQTKLAAPRADYRLSTKMVLQRARVLVKEILGSYDAEEHMRLCRFGKRAAVGVTANNAYLDSKIENLSCSREHAIWFLNEYLPTDKHLDLAALSMKIMQKHENREIYEIGSTRELSLVNVPKKYNTFRSIMPNTVIGGFYSLGLGKYIEMELLKSGRRIKELRYSRNIKKLQYVHQELAQKASKTRHLVTLDVTKASENFQAYLVNMLCPRDWYNALKLGRASHAFVGADKQRIYLQSFMAMGIGFTFPLQTLLFEAVIRAIAELNGVKGIISVYGDDCIYPRKIHNYVLAVFNDLGFTPNMNKTFDLQYFRESCGGDYYHGIDVRPWSPQATSADLKGVKLEAFYYKLINGLLRRWDPAEVPSTLEYLLRGVAASAGRVYQVPPSFPDTAGVKVNSIQKTWHVPWSNVFYSPVSANYEFPYLHKVAGDRLVRSCYPYYWNALRASSLDTDENVEWTPWDEAPPEMVKWIEAKPKSYYTSRITRERLKRLVAVVPSKVAFRYRSAFGTTSLGEWCSVLDTL
jgi:hypothetical protein